jgi:TM2 domain-containing membrane protein YozV
MSLVTIRGLIVMQNSHSKLIGYILWIFGFLGAHRFYFGRPISGTVYFCTFGLLGIGWFVDLFLIPSMDEEADLKYVEGKINYNIAWLLLTFTGILGLHRFYMGKWITGLLYLCTGGCIGLGIAYDFWTMNGQISKINSGEV